jgi:CO dehydrogenase nickel-insertion accessory protein CooC1
MFKLIMAVCRLPSIVQGGRILLMCVELAVSGMQGTECPTSYRTRHFFDNFTANEDIATKFEADLPHCVRNVTTS